MRSKHPQSAHFGQTHKLVRDGKKVTQTLPKKDRKPVVAVYDDVEVFQSIRQARRFMRTGSASK